MDERQVHSKACQKPRFEASSHNHILAQGFHLVGAREHQMLVAQGHYRCPHCRRADTLEMNAAGVSRR